MHAIRQFGRDRGPAVDQVLGGSLPFRGLVGRDRELRELRGLLASDARIVTVTGPVGVGKSRLATAAFDDVVDRFADGGMYVELDDLAPGGDLSALVTDRAGALDDRHFLLVLDGSEGHRGALGQQVVALVGRCPRLSVVVTGPERLGVYGEALLPLEPLAVPDLEARDLMALEQVPSVQLFVERTRLIRPGFALTEDSAAAVAELCARTDGLPLAIEFAAARMKLLSPRKVLTELDEDLASLSRTDCAMFTRHCDMKSALARSHAGLGEEERAFLHRIAFFRREFDFPAAVGVSGLGPARTQELLAALVDKSLLSTTECPDGDVIITMLGLTRAYVRQHLRETAGAEEGEAAHAGFLLTLVEAAEPTLEGPDQPWALTWLDHWLPDIRQALTHFARTHDATSAVRIAAALRVHWQAGGRTTEGLRRLTAAVTAPGVPPEVAAKGHRALAELLLCAGEWDAAERSLAEARQAYGTLADEAGEAACTRLAGALAYHRGDAETAAGMLERTLTPGRVGAGSGERADVGAAGPWERTLATHRSERGAAAAGPGERGETLRTLAACRLAAGDAAGARRLAEEALAVLRPVDDLRNIVLATYVLAHAALLQDDRDTALPLYRTALRQAAELGHAPVVVLGLEQYAVALTRSRPRATETWRRVDRKSVV